MNIKFLSILLILFPLFFVTTAFVSSSWKTSSSSSSPLYMSSNALERIIVNPLPTIYVYDHCPFCVRVRVALGLKNIKHNIIFVANDDVITPSSLIGKKMTPIFKWGDTIMPESLDIIKYIDTTFPSTRKKNSGNGGEIETLNAIIHPFTARTDLKKWQEDNGDTMRILLRPRYVMTVLPEFAQKESKDAFVTNHPLPGYEKEEWKTQLSLEKRWEKYNEAYTVSSSTCIMKINQALIELDEIIFSNEKGKGEGEKEREYVSDVGLSMDDVDLWARLRSLTLVRGCVLPERLSRYMKHISEVSDVPLYDAIAC